MGLIISSITAQIYLVPEEYICGSTTNNWAYKSQISYIKWFNNPEFLLFNEFMGQKCLKKS